MRPIPSGGGHFPGDWIDQSVYFGRADINLSRWSSNPVLPKGTGWEAFGVRELRPVIDERGLVVTESDGIWGYYGGTTAANVWGIGLAKSTDNGYSWTKHGSNPILQATGTTWRQVGVLQPSVVKQDNGTRVMALIGFDSTTSGGMGILTSTDGLTWTDQGKKLALADFTAEGGASVAEMGVPTLIKRADGTWTVLLECRKTGVSSAWRIFGATATDPTGAWTTINSGSAIFTTSSMGQWEDLGVANPQLVEAEPGKYVMLYNGINLTTSPQTWKVGIARSTDLTTWTRHPLNPRLTRGTGWENYQVETCFLFKEPKANVFRFLYQGYDANIAMEVGLAYSTWP